MIFNETLLIFGIFFASSIEKADEQWVHLYEIKNSYSEYTTKIFFSHEEIINPSEVKAIRAECSQVYVVDEAATEKFNTWITGKTHICNALEVIMDNDKTVTVGEESNKEEENPFAEEMKKNAEKKRKAEEERRKANKSVLRSYRIK